MFVSSKRINRSSGIFSPFFPFTLWDGEPLEWFSHRATSAHFTHATAQRCRYMSPEEKKKKPSAYPFLLGSLICLQNREILIAHNSTLLVLSNVQFTSWSVLVASMKLPRPEKTVSHFDGSAADASSQSQTTSKCVSHIKSMNEM